MQRALARDGGLSMRVCTVVWALAACSSSPPEMMAPPDAGEAGDFGFACTGSPGTQSGVAFDSGGETRHYMLHLPSGYECSRAWPMLVDFHGTASGVEGDPVEEYYALDALKALADSEGFIVVRPRSRQSQGIYQWDANPGDV